MKSRVDELHATIAGMRQELAQCHERLALLHSAESGHHRNVGTRRPGLCGSASRLVAAEVRVR